jgi:MFS family permease
MIAGIVVSGFGLAPVFIAPLASTLVTNFGIQSTMLIFGIAFLIIVVGLAFFLKNPPQGYVPVAVPIDPNKKVRKSENTTEDFSPKQMLKNTKFYIMWFIFFIGSGCGLMVISNISGLAKASMGHSAFIAVAIMAIGNAAGRLVAGMVSDKIPKSSHTCNDTYFSKYINVYFGNGA